MLHEGIGRTVTCEPKTGEVYRGHLLKCEDTSALIRGEKLQRIEEECASGRDDFESTMWAWTSSHTIEDVDRSIRSVAEGLDLALN